MRSPLAGRRHETSGVFRFSASTIGASERCSRGQPLGDVEPLDCRCALQDSESCAHSGRPHPSPRSGPFRRRERVPPPCCCRFSRPDPAYAPVPTLPRCHLCPGAPRRRATLAGAMDKTGYGPYPRSRCCTSRLGRSPRSEQRSNNSPP
jgi:hypothetical protein